MSRDDHKQKSEIIDHLYDVAVDPERYEALLEVWEKRFSPLRIASDRKSLPVTEDPELEAHANRAGIFLDRLKEDDGMDEQSVLDVEVAAAFLVTSDFTIAGVNRAATEILGVNQGDSLSKLDIEKDNLDELRSAIANATGKFASKQTLLRFVSPRTSRPTVFHVTQLAGQPFKHIFALVRSSELGWPDNLSVMIRDAFQLTGAEIDIVRALAEGKSVKAIAAERARSFETVRSQVRSILAKTETRSQAELIRITIGLMEVVSSTSQSDVKKVWRSGSAEAYSVSKHENAGRKAL